MSEIRISFPKKAPLANTPTSLRLLERFSRKLGGPKIWLKNDDLTGFMCSGNKIRKLEYLVADARSQKSNVLISCGGVQSNHCRAVAAVAAQEGMKCELILRDDARLNCEPNGDGNLLLDRLFGADIHLYPINKYISQLDNLFVHHKKICIDRGDIPYAISTGGSDEVGLWGYIDAAYELVNQFENSAINPEAIVCATGSAGTQAGLTVGCWLNQLHTKVFGIAVCDSSEYFLSKIKQDVNGWQTRYQEHIGYCSSIAEEIEINTLDNFIGPGYAKTYPEMIALLQELAKEEGVVLDPVYTGKAFYGMVQEIKNGVFQDMENIVFVHTGGGFGLFPFKNEFKFS
ncbi:D-cysteine desulfhydrase family protein [Teredinibacter sp. KSP-S5-2]|uniref:D-cysteine desulfhydrase family protein n=1 Tax=Teredinibacter sp. KSP-S5-2 TaxID=3034506 RepID=UPI002934D57C|nr:D-cysteine desulfhydrase family protein [Teredinibacter sp. KSP-S5-2]WNO10942.1 D-cysteine desulfhydrase family protein [Teredinibacter sp. KSP-S5-2]